MEICGNNWKNIMEMKFPIVISFQLDLTRAGVSHFIPSLPRTAPLQPPPSHPYPPKPTVYSWPQKMRVVAGNWASLAKLAFIEAFRYETMQHRPLRSFICDVWKSFGKWLFFSLKTHAGVNNVLFSPEASASINNQRYLAAS